MMEPTVTQNSALYFVQHKIARRHSGILERLDFLARARRRRAATQPEIRGNVFRWPRIQWRT
jgi:hypothetical protein